MEESEFDIYLEIRQALDERRLFTVRRHATRTAYYYSFYILDRGYRLDVTEIMGKVLNCKVTKKDCIKSILTTSPINVIQQYIMKFDSDFSGSYDGYAYILDKVLEV